MSIGREIGFEKFCAKIILHDKKNATINNLIKCIVFKHLKYSFDNCWWYNSVNNSKEIAIQSVSPPLVTQNLCNNLHYWCFIFIIYVFIIFIFYLWIMADKWTILITTKQVIKIREEVARLKKIKLWAMKLIREANSFLQDTKELKQLEIMFD